MSQELAEKNEVNFANWKYAEMFIIVKNMKDNIEKKEFGLDSEHWTHCKTLENIMSYSVCPPLFFFKKKNPKNTVFDKKIPFC